MYSVTLTPAAQRNLSKLPDTLQKRVMAALERLGKDPREPGVKKLKGQKNEWAHTCGWLQDTLRHR